MKRLSVPLWTLLILVILVLAGCYTMVKHPTGREVVYEGSYDHGTYDQGCIDCHPDAAYYHPYYGYARSHYWWNGYYGYPWWYYDCWWWYWCDSGGGSGVPVETGSRHLWQTSGWASGGWAGVKGSPSRYSGMPPPPPPEKPPEGKRHDEQERKSGKSKKGGRKEETKAPPQSDPPKKETDKPSQPRRQESHMWRNRKKGS